MSTLVATVGERVVRYNLDGTPFTTLYNPLDQLYDMAMVQGLSTPDAPVDITAATWVSGETIICIDKGGSSLEVLYVGDDEDMFNHYKNRDFNAPPAFQLPDSWSSGLDPSNVGQNNGTMWRITSTNIPGADALKGLCLARL